jgi:hypothetical protein
LKGNIHPSQSMAILGLPEGYSIQNCKKVAKQLFLKYHPDKLVNPDPLVFDEIMTAREYLCQIRSKVMKKIDVDLSQFSTKGHLLMNDRAIAGSIKQEI